MSDILCQLFEKKASLLADERQDNHGNQGSSRVRDMFLNSTTSPSFNYEGRIDEDTDHPDLEVMRKRSSGESGSIELGVRDATGTGNQAAGSRIHGSRKSGEGSSGNQEIANTGNRHPQSSREVHDTRDHVKTDPARPYDYENTIKSVIGSFLEETMLSKMGNTLGSIDESHFL